MTRFIKKYFLLLTTTPFLASCTTAPQDTGRKTTVTIEPLHYFTERITGDKLVVSTMVPQGGSLETYEPTTQRMVKLAESDLHVKVGNIGLKRTWMKELSQNAPYTVIIDPSEGIGLAPSSRGIADPYIWMSTNNTGQITRNIYQALVNANEQDSTTYRRNYETSIDTIETIDMRPRKQLTCDKPQVFLTDHPAFTYFTRDYEPLQIPVKEEGREPSTAQLKKTIQLAKNKKVRVMFVREQFETRSTEVVSQEAGAKTIAVNSLGHS